MEFLGVVLIGNSIMKKILYVLVVLCICTIGNAQEYKIEEIENIAYSFFNSNVQQDARSSNVQKKVATIEAIRRDSTNYMYLVNATDSSGWVIFANEKAYPIIIGHCESGSFTYDEEVLPPALLCILNNHMDAIDATRNNTVSMTRANNDTPSTNLLYEAENLIDDDYWKQSSNNDTVSPLSDKVYNKYCPTNLLCLDDEFRRTDAGCGPVAMAKIMRYWQWPDMLTVGINDTTYYYDWENMPRRIDNNTPSYQVDAVAHLFRSCGKAAVTAYTHFGTATIISAIHDALIDDFGYHSNLVRAEQENVDITNMLMNEIDNKRPVLVQAHEKVKTDGHSFVVDGYRLYNNRVEFHVHMGGGGDHKNTAGNYAYYDITYNGLYPNGQVYLIELYPNCKTRSNNISLNATMNILANDNQTYYSTNDIVFCANNNAITVNNGGHLLVKSNGQVRLKNGFHAKAGSDVRITTTEALCYTSQTTSTVSQNVSPRRMATADNSPNPMEMEKNCIEGVNNNMILYTSIYTISGQLLQTIAGTQQDISNLPNGMYILQHCISDGSIISTKITK